MFRIRFDETFTPAVISAIRNLTASSFEINERGGATVGVITRKPVPLPSSVTQGPVTFDVLYDNFAQLANGLGYSLTVSNDDSIIFTPHACARSKYIVVVHTKIARYRDVGVLVGG